MRIAPVATPRSALLWFGVFGAPVAWLAQHLVGIALTFVECDRPGTGRGLPFVTVTVALTAAAAAIAVLAGVSALRLFRATREASGEPPAGRVHFLATIGMTISPLFLCIIVMSGTGAIILEHCHQG